jgi:hypothetical protein
MICNEKRIDFMKPVVILGPSWVIPWVSPANLHPRRDSSQEDPESLS